MEAALVEDEGTTGTELVVHTVDGLSLVRVIGDVDLSVASRLRAALESALAANPWVVVDLSRVGAVDSIGLGVLAAARQAAGRGTGDLLLAAAPPFFTSVLHAARLSTVFRMYETVPSAMTAALAPAAA
ncbi:STAS domain-containing protein [Actinoplanes sp. HUAS TT8]|uniref:STAS domain-containing protein n=1 Tax=Actinoplanes sp. HUAS TT8 TaxID=3447453 RepID=UPI003F51BF2E